MITMSKSSVQLKCLESFNLGSNQRDWNATTLCLILAYGTLHYNTAQPNQNVWNLLKEHLINVTQPGQSEHLG